MTGTAQLQSARYENRLQLINPTEIGACPLYFDPVQREAWNELVDRLWWLNASDYASVEFTARLIARARQTDDSELMMKVLNALGKLGATPTSSGKLVADRSKKDGKKSRFDK